MRIGFAKAGVLIFLFAFAGCASVPKAHSPGRTGLFGRVDRYTRRTQRQQPVSYATTDLGVTAAGHRAARRDLKFALHWPLEKMSAPIGRWRSAHEGIDLPGKTGTPIHAAQDGVVLYSGRGIKAYGNLIVLRHTDRLSTVYAHNRRNLVVRGQKVRLGQKIALMGSSGSAQSPQLHFEVRDGEQSVDPTQWVNHLPSATFAEDSDDSRANQRANSKKRR
ncbi:MAG: M23 family metallopeptidase, partial [Bdellovibrionota bacterium]